MNQYLDTHSQALVKGVFITHIFNFLNHDEEYFNEIFKKYEYDEVLDLCKIQQYANIGATWDGKTIRPKPVYKSWVLGEDLDWHPPVPKPNDLKYCCWNEEKLEWVDRTKLVENANKAINAEKRINNLINNVNFLINKKEGALL